LKEDFLLIWVIGDLYQEVFGKFYYFDLLDDVGDLFVRPNDKYKK
jgi:hypothetical protein